MWRSAPELAHALQAFRRDERDEYDQPTEAAELGALASAEHMMLVRSLILSFAK